MFQFDGSSKIIQGVYTPTGGSFVVDIKVNLYSAWKQWVVDGTNAKFLQAFSTTGGDPISGTLAVGSYFFLENGWKIRPVEADHRVVFLGNLYTRDDSSPFLPVDGFSVLTEMRNSSLTQTVSVGSGVTGQDKLDIAALVAQDLTIINENVKKASLLIPATENL